MFACGSTSKKGLEGTKTVHLYRFIYHQLLFTLHVGLKNTSLSPPSPSLTQQGNLHLQHQQQPSLPPPARLFFTCFTRRHGSSSSLTPAGAAEAAWRRLGPALLEPCWPPVPRSQLLQLQREAHTLLTLRRLDTTAALLTHL